MKRHGPGSTRVIHLRVEAPSMPAPGAACNGCGVCCAWAPCPMGMIVSGRRQGRCRALRWDRQDRRYRCAVVVGMHRRRGRWPVWALEILHRLARRWIAAGTGCDSVLVQRRAD